MLILHVLWLNHGTWHVARHYRGFHKMLKQLASEQNKETTLQQTDTVQT